MILYDNAKEHETVKPFAKDEIVKREDRGPSTAELLKISGEAKKKCPVCGLEFRTLSGGVLGCAVHGIR